MIYKTRSISSADTERLGEILGRHLSGGEVIELMSDLGGGKTTFVRGLARGAGSKHTVTSPTFTLSKVYKAGKMDIHHFDFYRLHEPGVLADQLRESLDDPTITTVIEWSEVVADVLPKNRLTIKIEPVAIGPEHRDIAVMYPEDKADMFKKLENERERSAP